MNWLKKNKVEIINLLYQLTMFMEELVIIYEYFAYRFPPSVQVCELRTLINLQKGLTIMVCAGLMWWYNNWTYSAYAYMAIHGSYGIIWLLKDQVIPDPRWEYRISLGSAVLSVITLGSYWIGTMASNKEWTGTIGFSII